MSPVPALGKSKFSLRRKLSLGLAVVTILVVAESGYELFGMWRATKRAQDTAFAVTTGNDLAMSIKDLAVERGRTNAVLHAPGAVSDENRAFIHARRTAGTATLDRALAALSKMRRRHVISSTTAAAIDEIELALNDVNDLRRQADDAIAKPLALRDPKVVEAWLPAMTIMLQRIARTSRILDELNDPGNSSLSALIRLRSAALDLRLSTGGLSALLAEGIASQRKLPAEKIATIDKLRGRAELLESEINGLEIVARDDSVATSVSRAMGLYFGDFQNMCARAYTAATADAAYSVDAAEFGRSTVRTLDSVVEIAQIAGVAATKLAAARFESARRKTFVSLLLFAAVLGSMAALILIGIKHVVQPIERVTASLRERSARGSKTLPDINIRTDEIGEMSRAIEAFETTIRDGQAALAASEERLQFLLSAGPAVIYSRKPRENFDITYISPNVLQKWGHVPEDFLADSAFWQNNVHPDDVEIVLADLRRLSRHGSATIDYRFRNRGSGWRWIRDTLTIIHDSAGEPREAIGAWIDITPQKEATNALRELNSRLAERIAERTASLVTSERTFATLADVSPVGVFRSDAEGRYQYVNTRWSEIAGISQDGAAGEGWIDAVHEDDRAGVLDQWSAAIRAGGPFQAEYRLMNGSGQVIWVIGQSREIRNPDGPIVGYIGAITDVTELKKIETKLAESEARFRSIIEHLPLAVVVKSRDRRFIAANPMWERMYGLSEEKIVGKTTADVFSGRSRNNEIDRQDREVVESHQVSTRSASMILADGKEHDLVFTKFPIFDAAGKFTLIGGFIRDVTDQVETIRALRQSEARLRGIIDNLPISLDVRDKESRYLLINRICSEWYGIRESDAVGKTNAELFPDHPISNEISAAADREVIETHRRNVRESERTLTDGKKHLLEIVKFPISDPFGDISSIGTFVADVTERRLTETALRLISTSLSTVSGQEYFDTLVRLVGTLLGVGSVVLGEIVDDTRSRIRTRAFLENHRLAENFEYDIAGMPVESVISNRAGIYAEDAKDTVPEPSWLSRLGIESYAVVLLRDTDGQAIGHLAAMSTRPIANPELAKSILELFATSAAAELQRVRLEARFRDLFEYSPDGLIMANGNGKIVQVNRTAETMFGYSRSEIVGELVEVLIPENFRSQHTGLRQRYVSMPLPREMAQRRMNLMARRKDGSTFPVEINLSPIRLGDAISVVASIQDISERVSIEQQLRHVQKMEAIGEMTGGLAHDFNNLLAVIITNLEMISQRAPSDPITHRMIARAVEASERSGQMIQRLLAFSRKQSLTPKVIDLNALILRVRDMIAKPLGEEIEIGLAICEDLWLCQADAAQVESAIINLAINARDAMPDGGTLTIESDNIVLGRNSPMIGATAKPGEYVMLAVADTGTGMAPDVLARCIEPFFTTKDIGKGSGLGLSMVFGLANQSGGYLDIASLPGHGTTVRIYLPRVLMEPDRSKEPRAMPAESTGTSPDENGRRIHVLVVEDDADLRASSVTAMESCGYRATATGDGPSALSALDANPDIEILFSDVILPGGMNGVKLAEEAVRRRPGLLVLLTSGYSGDALARKESPNFSWQILKKPYRFAELRDMLTRLAPN